MYGKAKEKSFRFFILNKMTGSLKNIESIENFTVGILLLKWLVSA